MFILDFLVPLPLNFKMKVIKDEKYLERNHYYLNYLYIN